LVGHTITGNCVSFTVTLNEQLFALPWLSRAVQVTTAVPLPKRVPEGGTQVVDANAQLSEAFTANVTSASHWAGSVAVTMFAGHVITGSSLSATVTLKLQRFVFPPVSVATQLTVVTPTAKRTPEAGTQTTVADPQLSDVAGANVTRASHRPGEVLVKTFAGHVIVGGSRS
jgi:hypothetical protein